ncbi:hypothetical protein OJ253_703 [Cryptosporidium canis]|uniref:Uncharacterized protein n=1 Tax=Cryptosporidium canis TaxID=195482 RepID=A0A9D5HZR6_9CRYT|nr:hypothetical protein OJ253_703 [Cryptosporidium canis]
MQEEEWLVRRIAVPEDEYACNRVLCDCQQKSDARVWVGDHPVSNINYKPCREEKALNHPGVPACPV